MALALWSNRARAEEIARQSRALTELQLAEEAKAEATRAYAAEVGSSYAEITAELEDWRAMTLAALAGGGDAHEDLAAKVEEVFKQRLKDAYEEDLERRTDWAAGVERGLNNLSDATASFADIAEEGITDSFGKMEDAFVSLARTGKVELGDLADFAVRQAYRIAQAYALDAIGGGGGIGGIGSAILSLLGLGGGSAAASSSFLSQGSFTFAGGGSFPDTSAFFLHGGGGKEDAYRKLVPSHHFRHARRYHEGLGPREFPAVLEDDEIVLTNAQQRATADTIRGLAQVASMAQGTAVTADRDMPVTVNVYGASEEARAQASLGRDGLQIDVLIGEVEGRMSQNIASGRGLAPVIGQRFGLQPKGAF